MEIDKLLLNLYGIAKDLEWPILKRKNNFGELTVLDLHPNYKATVFKTVWYWIKNMHVLVEKIEVKVPVGKRESL